MENNEIVVNNEEVLENVAEEVVRQSSSSGVGALAAVVGVSVILSVAAWELGVKPAAKWVFGKIKKPGTVVNAEFKDINDGDDTADTEEA